MHFIRHGRTLWNETGRYQGVSNVPLSPAGRQDAGIAGDSLQATPLDAIISSDLRRAEETAWIIAERLHPAEPPIYYDPGLREIDFGAWEGLTFSDIEERWGPIISQWYDDPYSVTPPQGEPFLNFETRVISSIKRVASNFRGRQVAVVTHGGVIAVADAWLRRRSLRRIKALPLAPGKLMQLVVDPEEFPPLPHIYENQ